MSDREMYAYAIIAIAALGFAIAVFRWWYLTPAKLKKQRGPQGRVYRSAQEAPRRGRSDSKPAPTKDAE